MKKTILFLLTLLLVGVQGVWAQSPSGNWSDASNRDTSWGSDYESADEFTINDEADFAQFAYMVNNSFPFTGKTVRLNVDLDMSAHYWMYIGGGASNSTVAFCGTFDGQGYTVSGLRNYPPDKGSKKGVFGKVDNGTVRNLKLTNSYFYGLEKIGGIVGELYHGTVENCHTDATVLIEAHQFNTNNGCNSIGGIVGFAVSTLGGIQSKIEGCSSATEIIFTMADGINVNYQYYGKPEYFGGVLGYSDSWETMVRNCFYYGSTPVGADADGNAYLTTKVGTIAGYDNHLALDANYYYTSTGQKGIGTESGSTDRDNVASPHGAVPVYKVSPTNLSLACCYYNSYDGLQDVPSGNISTYSNLSVFHSNLGQERAGGVRDPQTGYVFFNGETYGAESTVFKLTPTVVIPEELRVYNCSGTGASIWNRDVFPSEKYLSVGTSDVNVSIRNIGECPGSGTAADPYLMTTVEQWNYMASQVNDGTTTYSGKFFRLDADISVTTMVGGGDASNKYFKGTFNGNNHTITFNATNATEQYIAPFRRIQDATIMDVKLTGSVSSGNRFAGGIVAYTNGTSYVTNCTNSTSISTVSYSGNGTPSNGGIVGMVGASGTINISGCIFNGQMDGTRDGNWSGILGLCNSSCTANITDCLFMPQSLTIGSGNHTLHRTSGTTNVTNCYFSESMGTVQGEQLRSISAGTNVTVANAGTETVYNVSGITSYGTGIKYNNVLYAGSGDNVSLTLGYTGAVPQYSVASYAASAGVLSGTTNPYALTMPDEDVTINANIVDELWSGSGTEADPYLIQNRYDLDMLAYRVKNWPVNPSTDSYYIYTGKYFKMTADIDYSSVPFDANDCNYTPIGVYNSTDGDVSKRLFRGVFDGDGHVVSGITINSEHSSKGLFANNCGTVRNVAVSNSSIAGHSFIGAIIGQNDGVVENCHAASNVTVSSTATLENLNTYCGGIVGYNYGTNNDLSAGNKGVVSLCTSAASVTNTNNGNGHGGIAGYNNGRVSQCIYSGNIVEGNTNKGPIIGTNVGTVTNCYWTNNAFAGCSAADNADNTGYITTHAAIYSAMNQSGYSDAFKALAPNSITLNGRTLYKDGDWNTLCLPFSLSDLTGTPLEGATIMELDTDAGTYTHATGLDNTTLYLNFKNASSIVAGTPYIIKWDKDANYEGNESTYDISNPTFTGVTVSNETHNVSFTGGQFLGTYGYQQFTTDNQSILFMGAENTLYWPQSGATIGAFRAYFHLGANQARSFVLNFDDETTSIRSIDNGQQTTENVYNLNGQKVVAPTKGLYIVNGKKVIMK